MTNFPCYSHFNMAYDMLNHLYGGNLIKPASDSKTLPVGQLLLFDQEAFMNAPSFLVTDQDGSLSMSQWIQKSMALYRSNNWEWSTSDLFNITMPSVALSLKKTTTTKNSLLSGFDKQGFVYFPSACANGQKCSIHIALHGCKQGLHVYNFSFILLNFFLPFFLLQANRLSKMCLLQKLATWK